MTKETIELFYQELYQDPEFIEYLEQKNLEYMEGMDKYYETLQIEEIVILPDNCELP
jgi:hypothetical protein